MVEDSYRPLFLSNKFPFDISSDLLWVDEDRFVV
jgi:hypothetical protein